MTLPSLRRILRSHYQERDATDLYKQLAKLAQVRKESAQLSHSSEGAGPKAKGRLCKPGRSLCWYMVHIFGHTILTGLRKDNKAELRPHLEDPN